jgi:hypothetical protein
MNTLLRLLLVERFRKLNQSYGLQGYACAVSALFLLAWSASAVSIPWIQNLPEKNLGIFMLFLWIMWTLFAVATSKDLSWQIRLERLRIFPSPGFFRLYLSTFVLGFLSFPILAGMTIPLYWSYIRKGFQPANALTLLFGYFLFIASVRASASLGRSCLFFSRTLSSSRKIASGITVLFLLLATSASTAFPNIHALHPAKLFGCMLAGEAPITSLLWMGFWVAILLSVDSLFRFDVNYAGAPGALTSSRFSTSTSSLLHQTVWLHPIFTIGILGWLRNRSAFLLFLWGTIYSFLWTYYSRPDVSDYFLVFTFMNLVFHSHFRGNLFGMDRGGAWIYYRFPTSIDRIVNSKSLSLGLLQLCMIASLLIAGIFRAASPLTMADWSVILSYVCSGILFGEMCGFFFSIRQPAPIDRTSMYDGSASASALIICVLQSLFFLIFLLAAKFMQHHLPLPVSLGIWAALPLSLFGLRHLVLKRWVHQTMVTESEVFLEKLLWD